ncbi:MAG TPA: SUMF1/EgtB/PvdO family nonheme iron enzyme, partial [Spirochaetota bacterium]|nr:SUMF1/EgtB/PvdO family nonheme iron enzyme [Spirochaetota bacterium]
MKMRVCSLCVGLAMLGLVVTVHADRDVKAHETGSATMVLVPGGTFRMGNVRADNEGSDSERPVHQVTLSPYWIGKYEVTYPLWVRVRDWAKANGYEFENEGREGYGQSQTTATPQANSIDEDAPAALASNTPTFSEQPVVMINWYDMVKWCNAYSQMQGLTPCYYTGSAFRTVYKTGRKDLTPQLVNWNANGYRLPTEAEWELAAKGGAAGAANPFTYAGGDNPDEVAWYKKNSGVATHFVGTKRPNQLGIHDMS